MFNQSSSRHKALTSNLNHNTLGSATHWGQERCVIHIFLMIPALIPVSLDNCRMLECTVFLTPCAQYFLL